MRSQDIPSMLQLHGENLIDVSIPSYISLLMEEVFHPFYIFQVCLKKKLNYFFAFFQWKKCCDLDTPRANTPWLFFITLSSIEQLNRTLAITY
jgi:hypothetical protein